MDLQKYQRSEHENIGIKQVHARTRDQDGGALVIRVLSLKCWHDFEVVRYGEYIDCFIRFCQFFISLSHTRFKFHYVRYHLSPRWYNMIDGGPGHGGVLPLPTMTSLISPNIANVWIDIGMDEVRCGLPDCVLPQLPIGMESPYSLRRLDNYPNN